MLKNVDWRRIFLALGLAVASQTAFAYLRSFHAQYDVYYPGASPPDWVDLWGPAIVALYWWGSAFVSALPLNRYKWLMGAIVGMFGHEFVNLVLQPGLNFPPPPPGGTFHLMSWSGEMLERAMVGAVAGLATAGFLRSTGSNSFKQKPLRDSA